jgi:hypothetical protein
MKKIICLLFVLLAFGCADDNSNPKPAVHTMKATYSGLLFKQKGLTEEVYKQYHLQVYNNTDSLLILRGIQYASTACEQSVWVKSLKAEEFHSFKKTRIKSFYIYTKDGVLNDFVYLPSLEWSDDHDF